MGRDPAKKDTAAPAFLVACMFFSFFGFSSAVTVPAAAASSPPITCGSGTFLDERKDVCICDGSDDTSIEHQLRKLEVVEDDFPETLQILGLFDIENPPWVAEVFDYTMQMLNDHSDGWRDDVLNDGTTLSWTIRETSCDGTIASRSYWNDRTENGHRPSHGIVGCRCSGASLAVARIAGLEAVPQISFASTSEQLSDNKEFPYFARTVSPDESSAIVAALRGFGWDRMTMLYTDTPYAQGLATSVQRLWTRSHNDESGVWTGTVAYSYTIGMKQDGSIDDDSVRQALEGVPTDDPTINSRVVLLISHDQDAFHVLRIAAETEFQPDTIWVGCPAWSAQFPPDGDLSGIPYGAIGVTPYRNRNADYQEFLEHFQQAQKRNKKTPWDELLGYEAEQMADSVLAMVMALSNTKVEDRRNGTIVMSKLLNLNFEGVSGNVSFTPEGDRRNPLFSLVNLKPGMVWEDVGKVSLRPGSAEISLRKVCFAGDGCNLSSAPDDSYPVPPTKVPAWVISTISVIAVVLVLVTIKYCLVERKKKKIKSQISEMQKKMEAMKNIDNELLDINEVVEEAKRKQASLILKRAALQETPTTWSDDTRTLVPVSPDDEQYWAVLEKLRETLPDGHISKLWRVQNSSLWSYYSFHKDRLESNDIPSNERRVWHGTSTLDPSVVYDDQFDGFMMQFAASGLWGRGIYFADKAAYSKHYSHSPAGSTNQRPPAEKKELEMFFTRLIVGKEAKLEQNRNLSVPPIDASTGLKFNTVTGHTAGSQVWIVYENGRAYPEYLVRYYSGGRDKNLTPYKSKEQAQKSISWKESKTFDLKPSVIAMSDIESGAARQGLWEYESDTGWVAYDVASQALIERTFMNFCDSNNPSLTSTVRIQGPAWEYEIDVNMSVLTQTNLGHSGGKQRKIRFQETQNE